MPKCSVVGCGMRSNKKVSLHRLPKNEFKKKKWIEALGAENIRQNVKFTYICSLHFHESAFNKTLGVIRLRDDEIPLPLYGKRSTSDEQQHEEDERNPDDPHVLRQFANIATKPAPSGAQNRMVYEVYSDGSRTHELIDNQLSVESITAIPNQPVPDCTTSTTTTGVPRSRLKLPAYTPPVPAKSEVRVNPMQQFQIKKLEQTCGILRRKVKTLGEKLRRQNKRITNYKNIIKDLQERNLTDKDPLSIGKRRPSLKTTEYITTTYYL